MTLEKSPYCLAWKVLCHSPWNIAFLPVKKPGASGSHEYDCSRKKQVYTVMGQKDAFFSFLLAEVSQHIWTDPEGSYSGQLTWARLPQGFKNSPNV